MWKNLAQAKTEINMQPATCPLLHVNCITMINYRLEWTYSESDSTGLIHTLMLGC